MDNISRVLELVAGELRVTCVAPLGEDSWKLTPGFLSTLLRRLLPLLCIDLINHSNELDCMLSPVSALSESANLGMGLETLMRCLALEQCNDHMGAVSR